MTKFPLIDADCDAHGHGACGDPTGYIKKTSDHNVTINGGQIATVDSANLYIPPHSHPSFDCGDSNAHEKDPRSGDVSSSVTINGSPLYVQKQDVANDTITNGAIDILNTNGNNSVTESPDDYSGTRTNH